MTTTDTPQQAKILRSRAARAARWVRKHYPPGTRVTGLVGGQTGTVMRHVPGLNAQGGYLVVEWESGHTGRVQACSVRLAEAIR